ncbi:hypothetical protein [Caulobacter sp. UC70_42]|uniref:hypothetical protein n=1 Tax=Caulobacter sp. UC70_42 TaxID=3374551 RepID=UPI00375738EE
MSKTIYLVSGEMEREALRKTFKINAMLIGNSHTAKANVVAKFVSSAVIPKRLQTSRVVIIMDRESRPETCTDFRDKLLEELSAKFPEIEFHIAIADMDTECWIFSDTETCSKYFKKRISPKAIFEGTCGYTSIKKHIGPGRYEKMTDGVRLMGLVDWKIIEKKSLSAAMSKISTLLASV